MGAVGGMLGLGGGESGTGIAGPAMPNLTTVVTPDQLSAASGNTQQSMDSQKALLQALQGQGGIQNQSNVYSQMQGIANGTGPNPAQAQYRQNANQLAAQTAGLLGSQKGMSPALQARLIAQQGASAQQNAAGQGAANLATQQLAAMNASGNIANSQVSNQVGQTNANQAAALGQQQALLNAATGQNSAMVGAQSSVNSANAGMANTQMQGQQGMIGGIMQGGGALLGMADGGVVGDASAFSAPSGPQSKFGQVLSSVGSALAPEAAAAPESQPTTGPAALQKGAASLVGALKSKAPAAGAAMAQGGEVNALVSPGELRIPKKEVGNVAKGKSPFASGEKIPGKPKVAGNSYANDTVPKKLSVGDVIIPNSIMQSKNPAQGAQDFVAQIIAKRKARG